MVATIAAAVLLSVLTTTIVVGSRVDGQLAAQAETISALAEVTMTTMAVTAQPDAEHVSLAGVADHAAQGNLVFSPSTTELAVVATGLTPPKAGYEYRCWVSVDGSRQRVGKMFFADDVAYWVGTAPGHLRRVGRRDLRRVARRGVRHDARDRAGPPRRALSPARLGRSAHRERLGPSMAPSGGGASR